jgi:hypothetical protein
MRHLSVEELNKEKIALLKGIRALLWAGVPLFGSVAWLTSYLSLHYLDRNISIVEFLCVMLPLWFLEIGDKAWRIRQINKTLSNSTTQS